MRLLGLAAAAAALLAVAPSSLAAAAAPPPDSQWPFELLLPPSEPPAALPAVASVSPPAPPVVQPQTSTLVDVLSASADFSTLLRLLQRTQLIPALNALASGTLFAPTNAAFAAAGKDGLVGWAWVDNDEVATAADYDNVLHETRGLLLYHLLNCSLPLTSVSPPANDSDDLPFSSNSNGSSSGNSKRLRPAFPDGGEPRPFETLLFPAPPSADRPSKPGPWLPTPSGQLGREGQRVRGVSRPAEDGESAADDWVGVDGQGRGGVRVEGEPQQAGNGVVVRVGGVLDVPADVGTTILAHPDLSYLSALLSPTGLPPPSPLPPSSYLGLLHSLPTLSLFAPSNAAFAALPQVERTYLESGFAADDVQALVDLHASRARDVAWRERFARTAGKGEVEVVGGRSAWVRVGADGAMEVGMEDAEEEAEGGNKGGARVTEPDIYCANGVVHVVDRLLVPPFQVTTEKILIGLNATRFVSLLRDAALGAYINSSAEGEAYTFLAPVDAALAVSQGGGPPDHLRALQETLRYHILPGRLRPADLRHAALLPSELRTPLLRNGRQVVPVEVRQSVLGHLGSSAIPLGRKGRGGGGGGGDDDDDDEWAEVRFGGVEVVGEPIEVGRSIIYLVESFLEPPRDFVETAVASLDLTTFLAATFSARLDDPLRKASAATIFAPDNRAFARLGLVRDFLLLPEARSQLRGVLRHHVVDEVVYLEDLRAAGQGRSKAYPTLEGSPLAVAVGANGTLRVGAGDRDEDSKGGAVLRGDAVTANGALHVVDHVIVPPSVNITVGNLLRGAKATVMADLLERAGLEWVLNGTEPSPSELQRLGIAGWVNPEDDLATEAAGAELGPLSFTVLVPSDEAFSAINITSYLRNTTSPSALLDLLKLHVLPSREPFALEPKAATRSGATRLFPPKNAPSRPLAVEEDVAYLTLLSATSRFGDLAFRQTRDAFVVGIKGARGIELNDWADVGPSGRATPRGPFVPPPTAADGESLPHLTNGVTHGGGIFLIDSVLVPFEPTWAQLYGWTVVGVIVGACAALTLLGTGAWWLWQRRQRRRAGTDYEPVEEEED